LKTIKRLTTFLFAFVMILVFIPKINVQAAITDIKIVSETEVTAKQAEQWAKLNGATDTFIGLAQLYWKYAPEHGNVNPAIAYVQAAKETGYGNFGGVLNESYKNPCGLKTIVGGADSDPNAHQKFNTWDEGVQAHLDHLALYSGAADYPKSNTYDPRHFVTIKGNAVTVDSLGGKWAPSLTYGEEITKLYNNLLVSSGIVSQPETQTNEAVVDDNNDKTSEATTSSTNTASSTNTKSETTLGSNSEIDKPQANTVAPTGVQASDPIKTLIDNSTNISSSIGWKLEGGEWHYYKSDGIRATGWIKPDNSWYYLYSNGAMAQGWSKLGSNWYYLDPSGSMHIGWLRDSGKWYYLQGDGSMVTGLKLIDGSKYFLDISGAMRTGWFEISGNWYYFNTGGSMLTGWIKPYGSWFYLHSNGVMAKGLLNLNGNTYYLKSNGSMATGWIADGGDNYYFQPGSGIMVKDTVINGWKIGVDGKRGDKVAGSTSGKTIVIDPGHNFGGDDGAYATHNGITYSERDLNMQIAVKLKLKLEALGYKVIMTRNSSDRETAGVTESLTNRVNIANNAKADLFVSLHHNAAAEAATGVEVYYSSRAQDDNFGGAYSDSKLSASMNLAKTLASSITSSTGAVNRGAKDGNLFVCRNTAMPAVLIECGFITNPGEAQKCADSSYQDLAADAITNAISSSI